MTLKDLPFKQSFSSIQIKPIVSEEKDKLLSLASLNELSHFIPNIDITKDIDLLPIAFNACVVNRVNKNGDIIDTDTALAMYKNFVNKFIDTEHNRQKIIGVILTASISEFGTDKSLSEDDVRGSNKPFNITLGGIVWKAVNQDLCDLIEESNDPTSENYLNVSASWELGFSGYKIVELASGEKNLVHPIEVTDPEQKEMIKKYLKCFGGAGVKDGKTFYRMPNENVIPMGIGLTEKPAADVVGVAVKEDKQDENETKVDTKTSNSEEIQENFSQSNENNVKIERINNMKITSIQDITDENLKQCTASVITQFIASEIQKASEVYAAEKADKENMHKKLQDQHESLTKSVAEMKATMDSLSKEKQDREAMDTFNARMGDACAKYDFPQDVAKIVADDLKSCADDDMYAAFQVKADTLFRPYLKKAKAEDMTEAAATVKNDVQEEKTEKVENKQEEKQEAKASEEVFKEDKKEAIATVVENALDNAKEETAGLPNSSSASAPGLKAKYQSAFAEENFVIKL